MPADIESQLINLIARTSNDPYRFVRVGFPWGEAGTELAAETGPDEWQKAVLTQMRDGLRSGTIKSAGEAIQIAVSSGHGPGKSALVAWCILWALSTFEDTRGVVSANTETQLRTKTWPELAKWHRLFIAKHWFTFTATALASVDPEHEKTWRMDAIPWSERNTEAFAGLHNQGKRIIVVFDEACHDDRTEVLTEDGWKMFAALDGTERLLTKNQSTHVAEYMHPKRLFRAHRQGEMIEYRRRGASICVTPNHRMHHQIWLGRQGKWSDWRWNEAGKLSGAYHKMARDIKWEAPDLQAFIIPAYSGPRKTWPARTVAGDDWMRFLGWWMAEGHLTFRCGRINAVGITQKSHETLREIAALCERLGFIPRLYMDSSTPQLIIQDAALGNWLLQLGRGALNKRAPECVRMASARQQRLFLDAFIAGDGYWPGRSRAIMYTSSPKLADDLQEIALKAGAISVLTKRPLAGVKSKFKTHIATSSVDGFVVSAQWGKSSILWRQNKTTRIPYDGMVYCAELPANHLLFTRRDGYTLWSGNSAIPDIIWETTEGALTDRDTQILWLVFGNPTRNTGRFRECFGRFRHRWLCHQVDSRTAKMTNKAQIAEWVADYGEDSDFVRVRVRGVFPRAGSMQFIAGDVVAEAMRRDPNVATVFDPLIMGVDVARFGSAQSVIAFKRGRDARTLDWIKMRGVDTMTLAAEVTRLYDLLHPDALFVDGGGVGGGVVDRLRMLKVPVVEVQFGGKTTYTAQKDEGAVVYANKRAEMWGAMRDWLVGAAIPDDRELEADLTGVEYGYCIKDGRDAIILEKKEDMAKRGLASPDVADALALCFAFEVAKSDHRIEARQGRFESEYDPAKEMYGAGRSGNRGPQRQPWMPHKPNNW